MKRFWIIPIAAAVILIGWIVISFASGPREPSYKGRTLSQWIGPYAAEERMDYSEDPPERIKLRAEATEAVQAIGTNAIPTLLVWLKARDSKEPPIHVVLMNWINKLRGRPTRLIPSDIWKQDFAQHGFRLLGTNAQSAVPALIQIGYNTNYEWDSAYEVIHRFDSNAADQMMNYRIFLKETSEGVEVTNSSAKK